MNQSAQIIHSSWLPSSGSVLFLSSAPPCVLPQHVIKIKCWLWNFQVETVFSASLAKKSPSASTVCCKRFVNPKKQMVSRFTFFHFPVPSSGTALPKCSFLQKVNPKRELYAPQWLLINLISNNCPKQMLAKIKLLLASSLCLRILFYNRQLQCKWQLMSIVVVYVNLSRHTWYVNATA